jgi:hypothetical protein
LDRTAFIKISLLTDIFDYKIYYNDNKYIILVKGMNSGNEDYIIFLMNGNIIEKEMFAGKSRAYVKEELLINILKELTNVSSLEDIKIPGLVLIEDKIDVNITYFSLELSNGNYLQLEFDLSNRGHLDFCDLFVVLMDYFKVMQESYTSKKNKVENIGYYFRKYDKTENHPTSMDLSSSGFVPDTDNIKNEMIHFPYMGDDGWIKPEINVNFIGSVLKRVFSEKDKKLKWELWEGDEKFRK